jgi:superfamily II DNA/RNA helicase
VSTNVGEEGLDIAECDLVIFYDVVASEIRFIQRKGRTARHREGKVIILYCKDTHDEIYMHIALSKLSKMNVNLKSGQQLRTSYTKAPKEMIIEESPIEEPPSELPRKIETHQKQGNLQVFLQDSPSLPEKKQKIVEIKISQSLPVKFGIRKKLQNDQIPFEIVKSINHITLFDRVIIQALDPHQFKEEELLKKYSHLGRKYTLIVSIIDFVDFHENFPDEERLLKQKIKDWGTNNDFKTVPIDLPEELYFIVKNIYLHSKKEYEVK